MLCNNFQQQNTDYVSTGLGLGLELDIVIADLVQNFRTIYTKDRLLFIYHFFKTGMFEVNLLLHAGNCIYSFGVGRIIW